jgi:hypothetical protein
MNSEQVNHAHPLAPFDPRQHREESDRRLVEAEHKKLVTTSTFKIALYPIALDSVGRRL